MSRKRKLAAIIILLSAIEEEEDKERSVKKRLWSKDWYLQRNQNSNVELLKELRESNSEDYRHYLRMSDGTFDLLLSLVKSHIEKKNTKLRKAISAEERLTATLRFLATGRALGDLKYSTRISPQSLGIIIPETCEAIIRVLKKEYMKFPKTKEEWQMVAQDFLDTWNFPNCGGCIDGKHIRIVAPRDTKSFFQNYKGYHSIVLMAIVNANCEFIMVDVGTNGRKSDGGVIENTKFVKKLESNSLNLPSNQETTEGLNFVFVADDAFALREHILKPFPKRLLRTKEEKIYNYRVSRAKRCAENAFGIMASRFRIFHTAINLSLWKIDLVVMACCVLHNFLGRVNKEQYIPEGTLDVEEVQTGNIVPGEWRNEGCAYYGLRYVPQNHTSPAKENRLKYVKYFNGIGAVDWQENVI